MCPLWLSTHDNVVPDWLSREDSDWNDWILSDFVFRKLVQIWGLPEIDRFAEMSNAKCLKWNTKFYEPGSAGINALAQHNYGLYLNYCCPPRGSPRAVSTNSGTAERGGNPDLPVLASSGLVGDVGVSGGHNGNGQTGGRGSKRRRLFVGGEVSTPSRGSGEMGLGGVTPILPATPSTPVLIVDEARQEAQRDARRLLSFQLDGNESEHGDGALRPGDGDDFGDSSDEEGQFAIRSAHLSMQNAVSVKTRARYDRAAPRGLQYDLL